MPHWKFTAAGTFAPLHRAGVIGCSGSVATAARDWRDIRCVGQGTFAPEPGRAAAVPAGTGHVQAALAGPTATASPFIRRTGGRRVAARLLPLRR